METSEIIRRNCFGRYYAVILTADKDCIAIEDFEFDNLHDAIEFANQLTFADCERMRKNAAKKMDNAKRSVSRYDVLILLQEDYFRDDCLRKDGETYPTIYRVVVRKP